MFSWSSQAEEVLKVSQFLGRLIRSPGEAEERGVWSSQGGGKVFLKNNFIYLFNFDCAGFSVVVANRSYSLVAVHGLLIVVASLVQPRL